MALTKGSVRAFSNQERQVLAHQIQLVPRFLLHLPFQRACTPLASKNVPRHVCIKTCRVKRVLDFLSDILVHDPCCFPFFHVILCLLPVFQQSLSRLFFL